MAHKICDCDTDATLFSFGGNLFFLENQYNAQKHSLLQSIPYNHIYCSLIPRPLKMDEGLSTSKRQAEGEKDPIKYENLPILATTCKTDK